MTLPKKSGIFGERIVYFRGDSWPIMVQWKRGNPLLPIDITGATGTMEVNDLENPTTGVPGNIIMTVTGVITDAVNGKMTFTPSTVQTDQTPAIYFADFQLDEASGDKQTFMKTEFEIIQDIYKS